MPARIVSVGDPTPASIPAEVEIDGAISAIDLVMVPEAGIGDYVVTHSGFAIRLLPRASATETLALFEGEPGR